MPTVKDTLELVATSPWGHTIDDTRTLRRSDEGWEVADRTDPIHRGLAPLIADKPTIIVSSYGRVDIHPHGRDGVEGVVSDNAVIYQSASRSTDVVTTLGRTGVEELLVLHDAEADHTLRYRLDLAAGMTVASAGDGLVIFDAMGRHFMRMAPPAAANAEGARVGVALEWQREGRTVEIALSVSSGDTYPVIVDPAWLYGPGFPAETVVAHQYFTCDSCRVYGNVAVIDGDADILAGTQEGDGHIAGDLIADDVLLQVGGDPSLYGSVEITGLLEFGALTIIGNAVVAGQTQIEWAPLEISVPPIPDVVPGSMDLSYSVSPEDPIAPGSYGTLTVDSATAAVVTLTGGVYTFTSITLDRGRIECTDLCEIRVAGNVTMTDAYIGEASAASPSIVSLIYLGDLDATGSGLHARTYGPNGVLRLRGSEYIGRFVANTVEAHARWQLSRIPG